jgi:hypothetical protein
VKAHQTGYLVDFTATDQSGCIGSGTHLQRFPGDSRAGRFGERREFFHRLFGGRLSDAFRRAPCA